MNNEQKINTFFHRFDSSFTAIVPNVIAETATEFFKDTFKHQSWDGVPWPALNPIYAAKKTRGRGRILTRNGLLLNSIRPSHVAANRVVISAGNSKVPYARAHNEGLRISGIRKVKTYTNTNFMGKGKPVKIKAHTRTVNYKLKQRRFMGHSPLLNQTIKSRLAAAWNARK